MPVSRPDPTLVGYPAQRYDNLDPSQQGYLTAQEGKTVGQFAGGRAVLRWGAPGGRRDETISQSQPVGRRDGGRLIAEAVAVERLVEPVAARVSGEHSARAIGSVRGRSQAHDEDPRVGISEPRHGFTPVVVIHELPLFLIGNPLAVRPESRTQLALGDRTFQGGDGPPPGAPVSCGVTRRHLAR